MKLLIKELKGSSFRALDVDSGRVYRIMKSGVNISIGSLLEIENVNTANDLIEKEDLVIKNEFLGDSKKHRVEVSLEEYKLGDLIDGVPIFSFGKTYVNNGRKVAYAYFNS